MRKKLFSDFDIFSLSTLRNPLCIHRCAKPASVAARLRDLVLVMRELQVHAAGVNVEVRAEQLVGHRGAFDVPARAALAPRRGPMWLTRLRLLPQHEVERIALRLVDCYARARAQVTSCCRPDNLP